MTVFDELNTVDKIRPTAEWMYKWYAIMNEALFGGELGSCDLDPFTSGKGASGRRLGFFGIGGRGVMVERDSGRMFKRDIYNYDREYINRSNFAELCRPYIKLNGNYSAPESSWVKVLVHEMCHYYTYKEGICPKQGHGPEFRQIGAYISAKSEGFLTIERLCSAEEMVNFDLDNDIKAKNQKRFDNKMSRLIAVVIVTKDRNVRLVMTTSSTLVNQIKDVTGDIGLYIGITKDAELIDRLYNKEGYRSVSRTYRFYNITGDSWLKEDNNLSVWKKVSGVYDTLSEALGIEPKQEPEVSDTETEEEPQDVTSSEEVTNSEEEETQTRRNTENLEYKIVREGDGYNLIDKRGHKAFGYPVKEIRFNEEEGQYYFKMGNFTFKGKPGKWTKITENKVRRKMELQEMIDKLVKEAIEEKITERIEESDDVIKLTPDMDLGFKSPIEDI